MWDTIVEDVLSSEDATGHGKGNLPNATIGDDNEYDAADDDDLSWDDPKSIDRAARSQTHPTIQRLHNDHHGNHSHLPENPPRRRYIELADIAGICCPPPRCSTTAQHSSRF
jgi:hypothetical protein